MTDHLFTAQVIKKTFPEWTDFSCVHMSITLNIAYKAGLIRPPEEKISESPCAPVIHEVGSESPLQVPPHQRIEKMSYEDEIEESENEVNIPHFDEAETEEYMTILIDSVFKPENLRKLGFLALEDLREQYKKAGEWPDEVRQGEDFGKRLLNQIAWKMHI